MQGFTVVVATEGAIGEGGSRTFVLRSKWPRRQGGPNRTGRFAVFFWHPEIEQENVGSKLMVELTGFLSISSFSCDLYVFSDFRIVTNPFSDQRIIGGDQVAYNARCGCRRRIMMGLARLGRCLSHDWRQFG